MSPAYREQNYGSYCRAKSHATKPVTQLVVIKRQDGEVVLEGEAWCYTFNPGNQ
jgi:hypothetical protein